MTNLLSVFQQNVDILSEITVYIVLGSSVGVIIPDTISSDQRALLEDLLNNMTAFR